MARSGKNSRSKLGSSWLKGAGATMLALVATQLLGGAPSGLAASAPGTPGQVTAAGAQCFALVSWAAPASDGGSAITSYTIKPQQGGLPTANANPETVDGNTTYAYVPAMVGTYTFEVYATNALGNGPAAT